MMKIESLDAARARLDALTSRRDELNVVLAAGTERRKEFAFSAATGNVEAAAALQEIENEEARANADLRNIALAVIEAERRVSVAWSAERVEAEAVTEAERNGEIQSLLAIDDELDGILDSLRAKLLERADLITDSNHLRKAASASDIGRSICSYLDKWLLQHFIGDFNFSTITRIAERDGHKFKTVSEGVAERGPRPLAVWEQNLLRISHAHAFPDARKRVA